MFITNELKRQVSDLLEGLTTRVNWLQSLAGREDDWEQDLTYLLAAERALHTSVEYTTDIGSLIIDALVMRDPGSYADIIKVLVEEQVLPEAWFQEFEPIFPLRARFIRDHAHIKPAEVKNAVQAHAHQFTIFVNCIRRYLDLPAQI